MSTTTRAVLVPATRTRSTRRRMSGRAVACIGALALLPVTACAVDDAEDAPGAGALSPAEAGFEVVAELHPDADTVVRFTAEPATDGDGDGEGAAVSVTVLGPDGGIPYERLITEQHATPLELFAALAPAGSPIPEALRAAHDGQAQAQGRGDAVRRLDVDALGALTPISSAVCDSFSAFQSFVSGVWAGQPSSGGREQFTDSNGGMHFLSPGAADAAYLTACNFDSNRVDTKDVLMCSRYQYASSGSTSWVCEGVGLGDGMRVFKSWGCELVGTSYCKSRFFFVSAAEPDPDPTMSYLGAVQLHYVF